MGILTAVKTVIAVLTEIETILNGLPAFDNQVVNADLNALKAKLAQALAIVHELGL